MSNQTYYIQQFNSQKGLCYFAPIKIVKWLSQKISHDMSDVYYQYGMCITYISRWQIDFYMTC